MRIVVLRPLGLGDFLTGVPAYRAIARAFPDAERILAAPAALAPLLPLLGDAFHRLHPTQPLAPLDAALHDADVAIDLHGCGPESQRVLLAARPARLIAFANAAVPESASGAIWYPDEYEPARWCRMLAHAGIEADPRELDLQPPAPAHSAQGATIVHPGAASEARRWPAERFAVIARAERAAGRAVTVTGGKGEVALALRVATAAGLPPSAVVAGATPLAHLAALVATAGRVVCGDTGVAHLATAFRTPSVVLYGPVSPLAWGPPPGRAIHRAIWKGRPGDPHGAEVDPGLLAIQTADVLEALRALDGRTAVPA